MTRIDYLMLAEVLLRARGMTTSPEECAGVDLASHCIADELARRSTRFEKQRFLFNTGAKSRERP